MLVAGSLLLVVIAGAGAGAAQPQHLAPAPATSPSNQQPGTSGSTVADTFWSQSLGIRKRVMVWVPPSYGSQASRRYPVAYYLHGADGDENNWLTNGNLAVTLDSLVAAGAPEMIVVMPDGDDGFYTTWNFLGDWPGCRRNRPPNAEAADSYCVPWPHYDDYVARDLVQFIDRRYRTLADRRFRGIAGLSMGGYGAITLALNYPDVFSAAASHSGVLAPSIGGGRSRVPQGRFDLDSLRAAWGPALWRLVAPVFGRDSVGWAARDPALLTQRLRRKNAQLMPALYVDCGTEDFLLHQNRAFRDAINASGGLLWYQEYPGSHSWNYWRQHAGKSVAWLAARLAVP